MEGKYPRDSYTEQVQILSQSALNGYNRLFGGRLMQWIDVRWQRWPPGGTPAGT